MSTSSFIEPSAHHSEETATPNTGAIVKVTTESRVSVITLPSSSGSYTLAHLLHVRIFG